MCQRFRLLDTPPSLMKSAIVKAPPLEGKGFSQYEAVFLQLADEHRTVNAFELQELLEACLPNGTMCFFIVKYVEILPEVEYSKMSCNINLNKFFEFLDYIKSCACMEVCRQVVLTMDVSFYKILFFKMYFYFYRLLFNNRLHNVSCLNN